MSYKYPKLEELGLRLLHYDRCREVSGWREVVVSGAGTGGLHVNPYKATYLKSPKNLFGLSAGTLDLVREVVDKARGLGYDAWMCNDNPRNGGFIQAKQ